MVSTAGQVTGDARHGKGGGGGIMRRCGHLSYLLKGLWRAFGKIEERGTVGGGGDSSIWRSFPQEILKNIFEENFGVMTVFCQGSHTGE